MGNGLKFYREPPLNSPALITTWSDDGGGLGPGVADYLISKLGGERFCSIEPLGFFSMGGVEIKHDLIQFPETDFYSCDSSNLIVFKSYAPRYEWYRLLNLIADIAESYHVGDFYSLGGMVSLSAHTSPRRVMTVANNPALKEGLAAYGFYTGMDFRTPDGGRPTLSSFLLWIAKKRGIAAANLWVEIPFYLAAIDDAAARKLTAEFLNQRLKLGMDLSDINREKEEQESKINAMRAEKPEIDGYIVKLERGEPLAQEEGEKLVSEVNSLLGRVH